MQLQHRKREKMKQIYTIGYTSFFINDFIETLIRYKVTCVIDVRSTPFSQHYSDYNKDTLEIALKNKGILYRNYAHEFGARQENRIFYSNGGCLDFSKFISSEQFLDGVKKVTKGTEKGYTFALMCAEKDPINCHRSIMLGKGFKDLGYNVNHIKADGQIETQCEIEKRLLDMYFKDRQQLSLFSAANDEDSLISECYRKRNNEIGFNLEDV